ncbi:MAG: TolC family protein [Candidatus Calescibacterium sp.]|jgi:outer membrane protein TolC|nr:TolC family protein [Candidatus Calescibacterium sp.]
MVVFAFLFFAINLTLDEAVKIAVENNLSVSSQRYSLKDVEYTAKAAWSYVLPRLVVDSSYRRNLELPEAQIGMQKVKVGKPDQTQITLSLVQSLPIDGSVWYLKEAQKYSYDSQSYSFLAFKNEIIFRVVNLYITISKLLLSQNIAKENLERMKKHYEVAQNLFSAGLIPEVDLTRIETSLYEAQLQLKNIEIQLHQNLQNFLLILGKDDIDPIPSQSIDELIFIFDPFGFFDSITQEKIDIENSPDISSIRFRVLQLDRLSKAQRGQLFPQISFGFSLINSFGSFIEQRNIPVLSVGANLTFDFGGTYHNYLAVKQRKISVEFQLEDLKRQKIKSLEMVIKEYELVKSRLELAQSRLASAEKSLKSAEELFRYGKLTSVDLMDYEFQYENAKFDIISAKADLLLLMWRTIYLTGQLEQFFISKNHVGKKSN